MAYDNYEETAGGFSEISLFKVSKAIDDIDTRLEKLEKYMVAILLADHRDALLEQ